jgi:L-fuculose-phosphate aldolase
MKALDERELRAQICDIGKNLWNRGMVAANDGNISARLSDDEILCTPTGVSKGYLTPEMLPRVSLKGEVLENADGGLLPSSEIKMHLRLYQLTDKVGAVVHAHPMFGTVFAIKGEALVGKMMPESVIAMPEIPLAPYGTPSTEAVPDSVEPFVLTHTACLLESHGALSWGPNLMTAYLNMERLEYTARVTFLARLVGGERDLPESEIVKLIGMRSLYGL